MNTTEINELQAIALLVFGADKESALFPQAEKLKEELKPYGPTIFQNHHARIIYEAGIALDDFLNTEGIVDFAEKQDKKSPFAYMMAASNFTQHWAVLGFKVQDFWRGVDEMITAWEQRQFKWIAENSQDKEEIQSRLEALPQRGQLVQQKSYFDKVLAVFESCVQAIDFPQGNVWSTGYQDLDNFLQGGWRPEFHLIAARPSMGKTALLLCLALILSKQIPVTIAITEMTEIRLLMRLLAISAGIPAELLRNPKKDLIRFRKNVEALQKRGHQINIVEAAGKSLREILREAKGSALFFDYIQQIERLDDTSKKPASRELEISQYSRELAQWTQRNGFPTIAASQLNRSLELRKDKRPIMSDLRESGALEQDADVIAFLYRGAVYDDGVPAKDAELIIRKNRDGNTGTVYLDWEPRYTRFSGMEHRGIL